MPAKNDQEDKRTSFSAVNDENPKAEAPEEFDPLETRKYIVRHMEMEPENKDFQFPVNTCNPKTGGLKWIIPGKPVDLTRTQVEILKHAVHESSFPIGNIGEHPSGITLEDNPLEAAKKNYPEFDIIIDPKTGEMRAYRYAPKYSIEPVMEGRERQGWAA